VETKYIVVGVGNLEVPIIFPETLNHSEVARPFKNVISAGFCSIPDRESEYSVWGKSVSLGIESREKDAELLDRYFTQNY
jgi:hypothetical protein